MTTRLFARAPTMFGNVTQIQSKVDVSRNFIVPYAKGHLEARYVARDNDKLSIYVSSHSGCRMGCKMCYLTQQGQTSFKHADITGYREQVEIVMRHYVKLVKDGKRPPAKRFNIDFMARGEPMANSTVALQMPLLYNAIQEAVFDAQSLVTSTSTPMGRVEDVRLNISTIMPNTLLNRNLTDIFQDTNSALYYSMYSVNDAFRKKWLPNAMNWRLALDKIKSHELLCEHRGNPCLLTFHWCLIEGENDTDEDVRKTAEVLKSYQFKNARFSLVRFNPHPKLQANYKEPSEERLNQVFAIINESLGNNPKSRIVSRVGPDASASCGMFISQ